MTNVMALVPRLARKISTVFGKLQHRILAQTKRSGWIAHHGLQRNGTNFLLLSLKKLKINVINEFDPRRCDPRHKHFRWYADKFAIPPFIAKQYGNCSAADTIFDLNRICGYPRDTKHIVVRKKKTSAVVSLANWGLRTGWFSDKEEAVKNFPLLARDYDEYYGYWQELGESYPDWVKVTDFEDLKDGGQHFLDALRELGYELSETPAGFEFGMVPQSPPGRAKMISELDYDEYLRSSGLRRHGS
jgi:hypothetical protein